MKTKILLFTTVLALAGSSCGKNAHVADPRAAKPNTPTTVAPPAGPTITSQPLAPQPSPTATTKPTTTVTPTPTFTPTVVISANPSPQPSVVVLPNEPNAPTTRPQPPAQPTVKTCWNRNDAKCINLWAGDGMEQRPADAVVGDLYLNRLSARKCVYILKADGWHWFASMQGMDGAPGKSADAIPPFYGSGENTPSAGEGHVGQGFINSSDHWIYLKRASGWERAYYFGRETVQIQAKSYSCIVQQPGEMPNATLADEAGRQCFNEGDQTLYYATRPGNWVRVGQPQTANDGNLIGQFYDRLPSDAIEGSTAMLINRDACEITVQKRAGGQWNQLGDTSFWGGSDLDEKGRACFARLARLIQVAAPVPGDKGDEGVSNLGTQDDQPTRKVAPGSRYGHRKGCQVTPMILNDQGKWVRDSKLDIQIHPSPECTRGERGGDGVSNLGTLDEQPTRKVAPGSRYGHRRGCEVTPMVLSEQGKWVRDNRLDLQIYPSSECTKGEKGDTVKGDPGLTGVSDLGISSKSPVGPYSLGSTYDHRDGCRLTPMIKTASGWERNSEFEERVYPSAECLSGLMKDRPNRITVTEAEAAQMAKNGESKAGDQLCIRDSINCQCEIKQLDSSGSWNRVGNGIRIYIMDKDNNSSCSPTDTGNGNVTVNACNPMLLDVETSGLSEQQIIALGDKVPYRSTRGHELGSLTIQEFTRKETVKGSELEIVENAQVAFQIKVKGMLTEAEYAAQGYDLNGARSRIKIQSRKYLDYVGRANNQTDTEILCLLGDNDAREGRCSGKPLTKSDAAGSTSDWTQNVNAWVSSAVKNRKYADLIMDKKPSPNRIKNGQAQFVDVILDESLDELLGMSSADLVRLLSSNRNEAGERVLNFVMADDNYLKSADLQIEIPCKQ